MKYPAYPTYKDSGLAWLGDVPEHWEVKRLKYLASINDSTLPESTNPDYEFSYVDIGSVSLVDGITARETMIFENAPSRARRKVQACDIIVSTVRTYLRAIASVPNTDEQLIVSTGFAIVRPGQIKPNFLAYALKESSFVESVVARSVGVSYPAVNASEIGDISIPAPSDTEQTAIADFLDSETGRIDTLVGKKRKLVELLKEKRTALISRNVTHGLPADVAREFGLEPHTNFKQTGIEWLGEVPEKWQVMALKWRVRTKSGDGLSPTDVSPERDGDSRFPVIGGNGIMGYCSSSNTNSAVIIVGRVGALCGNIHEVNFPAWITDNALVLTINKVAFESKYLTAVLRTRNLNEIAEKTAQPLITGTRVRAEFVPIPPLHEQTAIAAYLDRETGKIDRLIEKVEAAIARLQEYRSALITAAVTGKIDVRGA